ncbi:hypothetical protein [Pontibacter kalidii]|uniref:hypothetical protein n=1 Tax=Pontibacter kalidii TaxID=2592049 RepID=UPI0022538326|nr:hypothetical protein [Pontibacter kalidii]
MYYIELNELIGGATLFMLGCPSNQSAYKVKRWLQETRPYALILFADKYQRIKEYEAARWVRKYSDYSFHNYLSEGYQQQPLPTAIKSLESALQRFELEHKFHPSEIVLVRAKKFVNA